MTKPKRTDAEAVEGAEPDAAEALERAESDAAAEAAAIAPVESERPAEPELRSEPELPVAIDDTEDGPTSADYSTAFTPRNVAVGLAVIAGLIAFAASRHGRKRDAGRGDG